MGGGGGGRVYSRHMHITSILRKNRCDLDWERTVLVVVVVYVVRDVLK